MNDAATESPATGSDRTWRALPGRAVPCRILGGLLTTAVLTVVGLVVVLVRKSRWRDGADMVLSIVLVILGLSVLIQLLRVWALKRLRYRIEAVAIELRTGVIGVRLRTVPLRRVQHVDVSSGLVERFFELATLTVHTAAGSTVIEIPSLDRAEAERLRDRVLSERQRDGL